MTARPTESPYGPACHSPRPEIASLATWQGRLNPRRPPVAAAHEAHTAIEVVVAPARGAGPASGPANGCAGPRSLAATTRAAARLVGLLAVPISGSSALRQLRRLPQRVPPVIAMDDFAPRRRHRYATITTDAETGRRVAVLPDREATTFESWLREHPGAEVVCQDDSATDAEAVRRALPEAAQISDR